MARWLSVLHPQADEGGGVLRIGAATEVDPAARKLRARLRRGKATIAGDFGLIKAIYSRLIAIMPAAERPALSSLKVALKEGRPELEGLPAARATRRIGVPRNAPDHLLEDLLLVGDFAEAATLLEARFGVHAGRALDGRVEFNDPKGNLSFGQYRDVIQELRAFGTHPERGRLCWQIERWADHNTFSPPVRLPLGFDTATIDVAQLEGTPAFGARLRAALEQALERTHGVALDPTFVAYDQSVVWRFNQAFWRYLGIWERVTGKSYQRALPKGKSESHHQEFIDEAAENFASHVHELEREGTLAADEELWMHEKAPGSGEFTAGVLDYLFRHYPAYFRRMHVVLSDVSPQVLELARRELEGRGYLGLNADSARRLEILFWDLSANPEPKLAREDGSFVDLRQRFIYFRHANFFDQLPTRLFAKHDGRFYEVKVRAIVASARLAELQRQHAMTLAELMAIIEGQKDAGSFSPDQQTRFINFWSALWQAVKFDEAYEPCELATVHRYGALLAREMAQLTRVRFVTSDTALATLTADIGLLHPERGYACFTDIFLQRPIEFCQRWAELAKYDNGVWVGTNGALLVQVLSEAGFECSYHPVELTLGEATSSYTLGVRQRQGQSATLSRDLLQQLTGIDATRLGDLTIPGLPRRMRNNLRDLPAALGRLLRDHDWSTRLDQSLPLAALMREIYYHGAGRDPHAQSIFVKLAALLAEVLYCQGERRVSIQVDLTAEDLRDLEAFLDHRPLQTPALDLIEPEAADEGLARLRLRLPTLTHRLEDGEFVLLAEVDLPRGQSVEQLRRRLFQMQSHVDALSLTSARLANPRFWRSRELLESPLLESLQTDRLVVTLEMRGRKGRDLERDIQAFEDRGVANFFILTGDFERDGQWWLDSVHGIRIADRMRNGEGVDGRALARGSRILVAGAMSWTGIPTLEARVKRDVWLKYSAGVDVLFTQPVYDLERGRAVLDLIAHDNRDGRVRLIPEVFPLATLSQIASLARAPGVLMPAALIAAYGKLERNVVRLVAQLDDHDDDHLGTQLFDAIAPIPGYPDFFTPERGAAMLPALRRAMDGARRRAARGQEAAAVLKAVQEAALLELGVGLSECAIAMLREYPMVSGLLFVPRNGRELRRLSALVRPSGSEVRDGSDV